MSEEEIMQGINTTIAFMKEELKAEHSCFTIKELWALNGLLDLYNKEKEQNNCLINEKNIYKDLTKQAQEDVKIWRDLYNKEKEKNKELEEKITRTRNKAKELPAWLTEEEKRGIRFFIKTY